ncbi:unnamed protein product, partial [Urochloa humidicola]
LAPSPPCPHLLRPRGLTSHPSAPTGGPNSIPPYADRRVGVDRENGERGGQAEGKADCREGAPAAGEEILRCSRGRARVRSGASIRSSSRTWARAHFTGGRESSDPRWPVAAAPRPRPPTLERRERRRRLFAVVGD